MALRLAANGLLLAGRPLLSRSVTHISRPLISQSQFVSVLPYPHLVSVRNYAKKKDKKRKRGGNVRNLDEEEAAEAAEAEAQEKAEKEKAEAEKEKEKENETEDKEKGKETEAEGEKETETEAEAETSKGKSKGKGKGKDKVKEVEKEKVPEKTTKGKKGKGTVSSSPSDGKSSSVLEDTIRQIEQAFGKGSLMKLHNKDHTYTPLDTTEVVPTGSLGLDLALGVGGLPLGRVTEIYGPESSGKTTLALHVIAEAQKRGKTCAFIDAEHALNAQWAKKLGVNTSELLISQPDSGEQALEIVDSLIKAGKTNVIVIDSVAALVPKVELEGEMGDSHIGVQARLMSQALRKISPSLTKSHCVLIFINQIRMKIGVMFGSPETTTEIRRIGSVKRGEDIIGNQVKVKVAKNKLAPPFREALFDIDFGKGISKLGEVIDWGVKSKVLEKMGAWYAYKGTQIGQGREKTKMYLEKNPEIAKEIETAIREKLLKGEITAEEEEEAEEGAEGTETEEKADE